MAAVSIEGKIFEALKVVLSTLSWVKLVEYEFVRPNVEGFPDFQLPAIQFFDNKGVIQHRRQNIGCEWPISIELIMKSTKDLTINQVALLDHKGDIENLIGANVDLMIPGMEHLRYDGWETDMTSAPYAVCRLDFTAMYQKNFTG